MRCWLGVLTVGLALVGCSGKYVVGTMDQPDGAGGSYPTSGVGAYGGSAPTGGTFGVGGAVSTAGSPVGIAGTSEVGGSAPIGGATGGARVGVGESCVGGAAPAFMFDGPVASTEVIWERISRLVYGSVMTPPVNLPGMYSEQTLMDLVDKAFLTLQMRNSTGGNDGAGLFIQTWLGLPQPIGDTGANYQWRMIYDSNDVFPILLESMHVGGGIGVFTEQAWLAEHKSISSRGAAVSRQLFGFQVPAPPPGSIMTPPPDLNLSDRQVLEMQLNQPVCGACHVLIDPPGYALDIFDQYGQYRTEDHGMPIDTSGTVQLMLEQRELSFSSWEDLVHQAEGTCDATVSVADAFLRFAMHQSGYDDTAVANVSDADKARIEKNFAYGNRSYPSLVKAYLQTSVGHAP